MTPECKILFPDLPPYIVVFGPTEKLKIVATIGFPGISHTFIEYVPDVRVPDWDRYREGKMYNRVYGKSYATTVKAVMYSDCEPSILSSLLGKNVTAAFAFSGWGYYEFVTVLSKFDWEPNSEPRIPEKYRYTLEMVTAQ